MTSRRIRSRTADLFAETNAAARQAPLTVLGPPSPQAPRVRTSRQLWYAVLFPGLGAAGQAAAALPRLSRHAQRFTSFVSIEAPDALLLEIRGSLRLFGTAERLHADIDACWRELAVPAHSAVAPATLAALWLARAGQRALIEDPALLAGRLAALPVACTGWDADRLQTLRSMGVTSIGELLRLPRSGLARRFGPAAVLDLDIALARQCAPRRPFVPRERFRERGDFETEIEHAAYLEQALEPLLQRCAQFLRARQAGIQGVELRLRHRAGPATRLRLGLASVTSEYRRLRDVLAQRLQGLALASPVRAVEVISGRLQPLSAASLGVFAGHGAAQGRDTAEQLVERLRARLGARAVYGVSTICEHRPEAAWRRVHALHLAAAAARCAPPAGAALLRPLWLLGTPVPLSPADARQLGTGGGIAEQGPERIESGWWDGRGVARDYYVVREAHGARWWVFQERRSKLWYLHGVFA
ncbi:MAG: Y-family DNA polymerase [Steroidobacterales bacterium]